MMGLGCSVAAGSTVYLKFTTRSGTPPVPTTLAGTPAVSIYKDNSTTESTAGVSLTPDFDSSTGLNHLTIDTSADTSFYANDHSYDVVITAGTVGGNSVVGEVVGEFTLAAQPAISSTGGVTLANGVAHGGTPGTSTATIAAQSMDLTNSSGAALTIQSSGNTALVIQAPGGNVLQINASTGPAIDISGGLEIDGDNHGNPAVLVFGPQDGVKIRSGTRTTGSALIFSNESGDGTTPTFLIDSTGSATGIQFVNDSGKYGLDGTLSPAALSSFIVTDSGHVLGDIVSGSVAKLIQAAVAAGGVASVTGDVGGRVLGGTSTTIIGVGVQAGLPGL